MTRAETVAKVKTDRRISHNALDDDIGDMIDACLRDLEVCGIPAPTEDDPLILNAIKLYVRINYTSDTKDAAAYQERYDAMKACLMMAGNYGGAGGSGCAY